MGELLAAGASAAPFCGDLPRVLSKEVHCDEETSENTRKECTFRDPTLIDSLESAVVPPWKCPQKTTKEETKTQHDVAHFYIKNRQNHDKP